MSYPEELDGCHANQYHYYVDKADIAAAELDNLQSFTVWAKGLPDTRNILHRSIKPLSV